MVESKKSGFMHGLLSKRFVFLFLAFVVPVGAAFVKAYEW